MPLDCAHAIETAYHGRSAGTFGAFGCFSFYVTKNLTTGEGGMVLTRDAEDAARIRIPSLHGMSADAWKRFSDEGFRHYSVIAAGFKCNMIDLQAAIGLHQLARIEDNWARRAAIWRRYMAALAGRRSSCRRSRRPTPGMRTTCSASCWTRPAAAWRATTSWPP